MVINLSSGGVYMNRTIITVLVVALMVAVTLSVAVSAERGMHAARGSANPGVVAQRDNVKPVTTSSNINARQPGALVHGAGQRLKICIDFVKKNAFSETPVKTCEKILDREIDCAGFLKKHGMNDSVKLCNRLFKKTASLFDRERKYVPKELSAKAPKWILERADSIARKYPKVESFLRSLDREKANLFLHLPRAKQKDIAKKGIEKGIEALSKYKLKKVNKNMLFKKREISKLRLERARKNFMRAKNAYLMAKNAYNEKRRIFLDVKKKLKDCKNLNSTRCNDIRERIKEDAKNFTIRAAEMIINHLEKIESKIEVDENMDEADAQHITLDLNNTINRLNGIIDDIKKAQTKNDIRDAARKIDSIWRRIKYRERVYAYRLINSDMWGVLKKSEKIEDRFDAKLAEMEERGINVSELQSKLDEYSAKGASAKGKYETAKQLLLQAHMIALNSTGNGQEVSSFVKRAIDLIHESRQDLKDAVKIAREIIKGIKDAGENLAPAENSGKEEGLGENETYEVVQVPTPSTNITANLTMPSMNQTNSSG